MSMTEIEITSSSIRVRFVPVKSISKFIKHFHPNLVKLTSFLLYFNLEKLIMHIKVSVSKLFTAFKGKSN